MAYVFSVNLLPATTTAAFFALKQLLKSVGWAVTSSSDGTQVSPNADVITQAGGGANGLANTQAWFVLRSPFGTGSFSMQRGASNDAWRLRYSPSAGFVSGGDATHTPTSTDGIVFRGGGTSTSPTFESHILGATEGGQRVHLAAGDAFEAAPFYLVSLNQGTNTIAATFLRDGMAFASSRLTSDVDPTVFYFDNNNSLILGDGLSFYGPAFGLLGGAVRTLVAAKLTNIVGTANQVIPLGLDSGAIASQRNPYVAWARGAGAASPFGIKGYSNMLRWTGIAPAVNGDLDAAGRVQWGNVALPWPVGTLRPTL